MEKLFQLKPATMWKLASFPWVAESQTWSNVFFSADSFKSLRNETKGYSTSYTTSLRSHPKRSQTKNVNEVRFWTCQFSACFLLLSMLFFQTRQRTWIRNCHSEHVVVLRAHVKNFLLRNMPCSTCGSSMHCSKTTGLTTRNLTRASLASFFIRYATFCHIRHAHDLAPAKSKTPGPWGLAKSYIGSSKIVQKLNFQVDWAHIRTCNDVYKTIYY